MINKTEFVAYYADKNEISKAQSKAEIDRFTETFADATAVNGGVCINGYFKSEIIDVPKRERVNPSTGKKFIAPAHKVVKVKGGAKIKNCLESE